jgi:3-isopropylmalate/(R)-2-methylmalate dehydratase small subunit
MIYKGKAWKFGDHVDTDVIIPARYLTSSDPVVLGRHCLEDADPDFVKKMKKGDFIVAGKNFGSGSSREHAPIAIKAAGVSCVIAESFARIFYRNAFNMGLPILESPEAARAIAPGDALVVDTEKGLIEDRTSGRKFQARAIPPFMQELVRDGGLIEHIKKRMQEAGRKAQGEKRRAQGVKRKEPGTARKAGK